MALIAAASHGHADIVRVLLAHGADARARQEDGSRALDSAAQDGHLEVVEALLAHDPGLLDLPGYRERTALAAAAAGGHIPVITLLLARGADPRRQSEGGSRPLDQAAQAGQLASVALLLAHDPSLLDLPGFHGRTALAAAAGGGHGELLALLLARGADCRARLDDGTRPLDWAAQQGHQEVVERLLAHDPSLVDLPGDAERTALLLAAGRGYAGIVKLLLAHGADPRVRMEAGTRALDQAAQKGQQEVVELLLAHDPALVDLPGYRNRTALETAAGNGHLGIVELLLARGADPRWRMEGGTRALDWAAGEGRLEVVERLLAHDPSLLDLPGEAGHTALMMAAGGGHGTVVGLLLSRGADAGRRIEDGSRALDWAAQGGHQEVVERLLAHDPALLDLPGFRERTALAAAAGNGHAQLVRQLLARGADPLRRLASGKRALDWAAQEGHTAVVEVLLAHDRELVDLPGADDYTALMWASGAGHAEVVDVLLTAGADPARRMRDGARALDWAAQEGYAEVVGELLAHDPSLVDVPGFHDRTALAVAAGNGHAGLVTTLLARGADPRRRLADGTGVLDWAAAEGHAEVVELLLAHDPGLVDLPGDGGATALILACGRGHPGVAQRLLAHGADPRCQAEGGTRALDLAAQAGQREAVELLLAHDSALLNLPGLHERTALTAAAGNGQLEIVDLLLARGADPRVRLKGGARALDWAAARGHLQVAQRLLEHDPALVDLPGEGGHTALMEAAGFGHAALVELLLACGADARAQVEDGERALDWAAQEGHAEVAALLLTHDPGLADLPGYRQRTALIAAAGNGHAAVVRCLLAHGSDPSRRLADGSHVLDWAAQKGQTEVVELLLAHAPGLLDLPGYMDRTALAVAAGTGHAALVERLLACGADPRKALTDGTCALDWAAGNGHTAIVESLLAHDPALLDLPGERGRTALGAAAAAGRTGMVSLLLSRGADPDRPNADGIRPADWAAHRGHMETLEHLLAHDARLLHQPGGECGVLLAAALGGQAQVVRALLARGANARGRRPDGSSALDLAATLGHLEVVKALLEFDRSLVHAR